MRYCSLADLQLAIPAQTLIWLSDDNPEAAGINLPVVEEAVRQAEELVDAHLRGRYVLPLDPVPTVVKDMTVNLARHWLYARRPEGSELPDPARFAETSGRGRAGCRWCFVRCPSWGNTWSRRRKRMRQVDHRAGNAATS